MRGPLLASGPEGLLVDLGGALGHLPAGESGESIRRRGAWVAAVDGDLVHLTAERPWLGGYEGALRSGVVVSATSHRAVAQLEGGGPSAVVLFEELSWEQLVVPPVLAPGDPVRGRVIGLSLDGPILSPRAVVPAPWPAVALANPRGMRVPARVDAVEGDRVAVRLERAPRITAVLVRHELPLGVLPGASVEGTVERVDVLGCALTLCDVRPRPTAHVAARRWPPRRAARGGGPATTA